MSHFKKKILNFAKKKDDSFGEFEVYEALYDYQAVRKGDLRFAQGDKILVVERKEGSVWWLAQNVTTGQKGYVPSNFVKKVTAGNEDTVISLSDASVAAPTTPTSPISTNLPTTTTTTTTTSRPTPTTTTPTTTTKKCVALFDFESSESDTMKLLKDEVVDVENEVDEAGGEWVWARVLRGGAWQEGYVPRNYLKDMGNDLLSEPWFYGSVSRQEAEQLLTIEHNKMDGTFLIRLAQSQPGFSLSVFWQGQVKHYKLWERVVEGGSGQEFFVSDCFKFRELRQLIQHYKQHPGLCCHLARPCTRRPDAQQVTGAAAAAEGTAGGAGGRKGRPDWKIDRQSLVLGNKLGQGQFGIVWRAVWMQRIEVAVKAMKPGTAEVSEFLREGETLRRLKHPRLVKFFGLVVDEAPNQQLLIVTELVQQGSLHTYLKARKSERRLLKAEALVRIGLQVAAGMAYLEGEGYVHRDLAARNVLVAASGDVKIADFGLARVIKQEGVYERSTERLIPIKWTAPEALEEGLYTTKSDMWSFGVLLYEVITHADVPYQGITNADVRVRIRQGYRMARPDTCPDSLYILMRRCWLTNPDDRPTFKSIKEDLEALLASDAL